jgi:hypothetical protein
MTSCRHLYKKIGLCIAGAIFIVHPCISQQIKRLDDSRLPDNFLKVLSLVQVDSIGKGHPITGTATLQDSLGQSRDTYSWQTYVDQLGHLRGTMRLVMVDSVRGTANTVTTRKSFNIDVELLLCCKDNLKHCSNFHNYKKDYPDCKAWQIQVLRKLP